MTSTFTQLRDLIRHHAPSNYPTATPESVLAALGTPSTSIAILSPTGAISADCISTVGDDVDTVFQAASISKPVAGMAAMKLVQQGKLRLDGKIAEYLPAELMAVLGGGPLATPVTKALAREITVAQLMSHTAGLSVHGFPGYAETTEASAVPDAAAVLAGKAPVNTDHVGVESFPGYTHSYSGGGITVLQLLMEHVTGRSFPELMQELVLSPLGMTRSFFGRPGPGENHARAYDTGYTPCEPRFNVFPEHAAAGLWTTPTDLLKVARAMQQSLRAADVDEEAFLPPELARKMVTEVAGGMALTWKAPRDPGIEFQHTGSNEPGWYCILIGYADVAGTGQEDGNPAQEGCGVCVMTNSALGFGTVMKMVRSVQYFQGWDPEKPWSTRANVYTAFAVPGGSVPQGWREWEGRWGKDGEFELLEVENGGALGDGNDAEKNREQGNGNASGGKGPCLKFRSLPPVRLRPAAQPNAVNEKDRRIWLVVEGLRLTLCLISKDGKKVLEVWNEGTGSVDGLEKTE